MELQENVLIIIRGNSGSGKSTVAKALQRRIGRNTLLIPQDVVRREMLWVKDGVGNEALPLLQNMVQYGMEHCKAVILEGILNVEYYEELFSYIKREFGEQVYAYYYDISFEETVNRHKTKPNKDEFGEEEMHRWWRDKDYIGFLPERTLTKDMSVEEVVELIYREAFIE